MTMKAMLRDDYCEPAGLSERDVDPPAIGEKDVLIRVRAAGVDQGTWHVLAGLPYLSRLVLGPRRPRNKTLGMDVAGTVEAVGAKVTRFRPGDEVFGTCSGAFAEYARAKATAVVPKPANVPFEQAGATPISGCTALKATRGIAPGDRVLVIGAGGGVGSFAVQLAAAYGATVTGVCGPAKAELVRSLGAKDVIDYTRSEITGQYDRIIDTAGGRPVARLRRSLTARGTLLIIGAESPGRWFGGVGRGWRAALRSPFTRQRLSAPISLVRPADLEELRTLLADGTIVAAVDRGFALSDLPMAITYLREGRSRGKIVVTP
jgi:NADPH:quinone reductase-like Zn-dependent oxidoreductase